MTSSSDNPVFPFTKDSVTKFMQDKKYIFDVSSLPPHFDRYFEVKKTIEIFFF
jgi:hypothetical protein